MNKMKRVLLLSLALIFAAAILAGCSWRPAVGLPVEQDMNQDSDAPINENINTSAGTAAGDITEADIDIELDAIEQKVNTVSETDFISLGL